MKIAVSAYSFNQAIQAGKMTILDVIPKAKEMGFDGIEITSVGITSEQLRAIAPQLAAQSKEYGMPICAYLTGADFLRNGLDFEVERLKGEVEIAALMGAPRLRHDAAWGVDPEGNPVAYEDALPILAEGYRRVTEYAAGLGVHTMIENHGYYAQDALRVKALIEAVNHKNFGWLIDMGNFMCADEVSVESVAIAAPYAVHVHAKDFHYKAAGSPVPNMGWFPTRGKNLLRGAIVGHGVVDVKGCIELIKNAGYDGWISIEFEGIEECVMAIAEGYQNLKKLV